jgi:hypothetical protein
VTRLGQGALRRALKPHKRGRAHRRSTPTYGVGAATPTVKTVTAEPVSRIGDNDRFAQLTRCRRWRRSFAGPNVLSWARALTPREHVIRCWYRAQPQEVRIAINIVIAPLCANLSGLFSDIAISAATLRDPAR